MIHPFDSAIAVVDDGHAVYGAKTSPAYSNMVGPFGGITAATIVNGLQHHPDVLGDPLAFTLNYVAPIIDGDWTLRTEIVRTNRTNQHWAFTVEQNDAVVGTGTAVFGVRRDTWHDTEPSPPETPSPDDVAAVDFPDFIAWAKNYEMRFVAGSLDSGANDDSTSTLWIRDEPRRPLDFPGLASLSDTFYPRVFLRRGTYMPAGTISLTTYFHATADELAAHGDRHVLATAHASRFGHGHFDQAGLLWGRDAEDRPVLLATTHQLVYFKDPQG
ncbi:MAG: thioesterase family protein [Gordonia sp. (in: high G+C Gram-positive bacteria)]